MINLKYNTKIIPKKDQKTSSWSGGLTTQIYIYPEDAIYKELNFKWRLSSAKVDLEESIFTHLPGISRKIMSLDNTLVLDHKNKYTRTLKPFEEESFNGDWQTKSYGKVTDFNLMMNKDCNGELECLTIKKCDFFKMKLRNNYDKYKYVSEAFYCINGNVKLSLEDEEQIALNQHDLFSITMETDINSNDKIIFKILNGLNEDIKLVHAKIFY